MVLSQHFPPALLRCTIQLSPTDPPTLLDNLRTILREVNLPSTSIYGEVLRFLSSIGERAGQVPTLEQVRAHYTRREAEGFGDGSAALIVLTELEQANLPVLDPTAFRIALDDYREALLTGVTSNLLIEAANILRTGTTVRQFSKESGKYEMVTLKGVEASLEHVHRRLRELDLMLRRQVLEGEFTADMEQVVPRYDRAASNPAARVGVLSGLKIIDDIHRGLRPGNLGLVLGFVGHMKTTFCLNWFYKAAILHGKNVAMASLETPVVDLTDLIVCMHSMHPRFEYDRAKHFVTFDRMRAGILTPEERDILQAASDDLKNNTAYGHMSYKQPEGDMTVADIRAWCERLHLDRPLDLLVIDYLGLVNSEKGYKKESYANLNDAVRQTKLMAIEFDDARGLPVLSPFQANREGFKDAEKNGGRYSLRALHGAPEAERSADLVYYVYLDDALRKAKELVVGNLKTRNVEMISDQFRVFADPATRMLDDLDLAAAGQSRVEGGI